MAFSMARSRSGCSVIVMFGLSRTGFAPVYRAGTWVNLNTHDSVLVAVFFLGALWPVDQRYQNWYDGL
jgi:hypothetical protein